MDAQRGIRKPRELTSALSIRTVCAAPGKEVARGTSGAGASASGGSTDALCSANHGSRARSAPLRDPGIDPNVNSPPANSASMPEMLLIYGEQPTEAPAPEAVEQVMNEYWAADGAADHRRDAPSRASGGRRT